MPPYQNAQNLSFLIGHKCLISYKKAQFLGHKNLLHFEGFFLSFPTLPEQGGPPCRVKLVPANQNQVRLRSNMCSHLLQF